MELKIMTNYQNILKQWSSLSHMWAVEGKQNL